MRIAVVGTGGVGGYFGGLLAHAGNEVAFIARGAHLDAIRREGLRVYSVNGDFQVHPALATDEIGQVGPVDYAILAVKDYHLDAIIPDLAPLVGPDTVIVPLLNGVDAHERVAAKFGEEHVVAGFCSIVSMIASPGVIRQRSKMRIVKLGEIDRRPSQRIARLVEAWAEQGVDASQPEDIFVEIWSKFLFIASFGGVSSLARVSMGGILATPETRLFYRAAMREVAELAAAAGVSLAEDVVAATMRFSEGLEPEATSSMQRDVAAGNDFELEAFSGKIVALGEKYAVPTPVHAAIYALLKPLLLQAGG